jgi:hypothetical protein
MLINRTELLSKLETASPGLATTRETVEQSSCFVFRKGGLITYNGDLACRIKCPMEFEGAVVADKLVELLRKLNEDDVEITAKGKELVVTGIGRRAGIRFEADITLPIDAVERPAEWQEIDSQFAEAVDICVQCTTKDDTQGFYRACVHIHPKYIEACDNLQMARYPVVTGLAAPVLLRRESVKHIVTLGITHIAETQSWVHFRAGNGLILSCRKYIEVDFPNLNEVIKVRGTPATLPAGLPEAAEKAQIFSGDNADVDHVTIELRAGKLRITGRSAGGWFQEQKSIKYEGDPLVFTIAPKMLIELTKRHNECEIAPGRLRVHGGRYTYLTCLGDPADAANASSNGTAATE